MVQQAKAQKYVQGMQQAFGLLSERALQGIKKQFAANKQYWEKRRTDFSRKVAHNLAVGDLVLKLMSCLILLSQLTCAWALQSCGPGDGWGFGSFRDWPDAF